MSRISQAALEGKYVILFFEGEILDLARVISYSSDDQKYWIELKTYWIKKYKVNRNNFKVIKNDKVAKILFDFKRK